MYKICTAVCKSSAFFEASAEELRLLLAVMDYPAASADELASTAGISLARARSALALWESAGVIKEATLDGNIEEEFDGARLTEDADEISGVEAAREIRDCGLKHTIDECAVLLERPALHTDEIKKIVLLYTEYGLDEQFILTLLASLISKSKSVTVSMLQRRAKALFEKGINTSEKLDAYIAEKEEEIAGEMELRRALGIYRPLTKSQRELARKWFTEYGYGLDIIGEAYDITVSNIDKASFAYMDKLLTRWFDSGCKTTADCKAKIDADRQEKAASKSTPSKKKKEAEKPRYGNFDPEEVFKRALERSYGEKK